MAVCRVGHVRPSPNTAYLWTVVMLSCLLLISILTKALKVSVYFTLFFIFTLIILNSRTVWYKLHSLRAFPTNVFSFESATKQVCCCMRKLTLTELSLCCSIVYHYNDAEWYVQFLQGRSTGWGFDLAWCSCISSEPLYPWFACCCMNLNFCYYIL